jgi:hypothetical protein
MSDEDDKIIDAMRAQFGEDTTDGYLKLVTATRSLTYTWDLFVRAPVGSAQERVLGAAMNLMMNGFKGHPEKAVEMIESLLALVQHMRWGGTIEDWFEEMGVGTTPGENARKEQK